MRRILAGFSGTAVLAALLLWSGCDGERFMGYRYEARSVAERTPVTGRITGHFSGALIEGARISLNGQVTVSDSVGVYRLDYWHSGDELLGANLPLVVTADPYLPAERTVQLVPGGNRFDVTLDFAAPTVRGITQVNDSLFRAEVADYQGVTEIASVRLIGYYYDGGLRKQFTAAYPMHNRGIIDTQAALFEGVLPLLGSDGTYLGIRVTDFYHVALADIHGYRDTLRFTFTYP